MVQEEKKSHCQRKPANAQFRYQQKARLGMAEVVGGRESELL